MVLPRPAMFTCATHGDEKRATSIVNIGRPIFKVYISNDLDWTLQSQNNKRFRKH